ncbi:antibiotic biosynthesis monooxygenase [Billgrantia desiderata]|uniref:antibiotic biosynthesis monooxygenase n=1 Tax=Billgrantia desiderata TaxID=52021 RepID=UPI00089E55F2|nr:antibiotic biosynthesis monooxygenase [Halomonas desiderata]SEF75812.1 hypothetical protein SAMN04487953_10556 [Halomonas desiderata]
MADLNTTSRLPVVRHWHGWTSCERADDYEALLRNTIIPGILDRQIAGLRRFELLRRDGDDEVEFITVMWFDSLEEVRTFAGDDYEAAVVPASARALLSRFDVRSAHFDVRFVHS